MSGTLEENPAHYAQVISEQFLNEPKKEYYSIRAAPKDVHQWKEMTISMISVIMLTYNRENLVARAIESILAQTCEDFEYIIVDNGSEDNSGNIAESYAAKDSRIQVIHTGKGNIGSGRNVGLAAATGDFVTFIDDDDFAYPDMLRFLKELAAESNADVALCGSDKSVGDKIMPNCVFGEKLLMTPAEAVTELLKRKKYNAATPTKLWRRSIFDKVKFPEKGKYDDISVIYKLFAKAGSVAAHGIPQYCFYRHPGNNSAFTTNDMLLTPEQLNEYFKAFRERTVYLSAKLPEIADYALYSEWSYMISMCNKIHKNNLTHCSAQLKSIEQELTAHYDEFYSSPYIEAFERDFMERYIQGLL